MKNKVYFIYLKIPEKAFNNFIKYLISNNHDFRWKHNYLCGLYAWTTSKKLLNEFLDLRNKDLFTVVKKDILSKEEYEHIKFTYTDMKLSRYKYLHDYSKPSTCDYSIITTTRNEYINSAKYGSENMDEFGPKAPEIDYRIFNKEMIKALDIIGYTTLYDIYYSEPEDKDFADSMLSYNKTVKGHDMPYSMTNELAILLYLYRYLFIGDDERDEVEDIE